MISANGPWDEALSVLNKAPEQAATSSFQAVTDDHLRAWAMGAAKQIGDRHITLEFLRAFAQIVWAAAKKGK